MLMKFNFEIPEHEMVHSVFGHLGRLVRRKEYGKVQDGAYKQFVGAKLVDIAFEEVGPLPLIMLVMINSIPQEFKLILPELEAIYRCHGKIKRPEGL